MIYNEQNNHKYLEADSFSRFFYCNANDFFVSTLEDSLTSCFENSITKVKKVWKHFFPFI